jgi:hypothetical protein
MMYIKIRQEGANIYPYNIGDLKTDFPNTSFPEIITDQCAESFNVFPVTLNIPEKTRFEELVDLDPVEDLNGKWVQSFRKEKMTNEKIEIMTNDQWTVIKSQRNQYLQECDWTQLSDSPLTIEKKQDWLLYRQSLREVTLQADPFNITWPVKPTY